MTTIADLIDRAYPALRHHAPQGLASFAQAASTRAGMNTATFAATTGIDVAEVADYEAALIELRAITPGLDYGELGDLLDRLLAEDAPWFVSHFAAVRWVRGETLAGKPWAAVRQSDPGHPAPAPPWPDPDTFRAALAAPSNRH